MPGLVEELLAARAAVSRLEHAVAAAACSEVGHRWKLMGGANCGCEDGSCSVPVNTCTTCGDCDYGENAEAVATRAECEARL